VSSRLDGPVEDLAGVHRAVEHGREQALDACASRGRAAGQGDVAAEEAAEPDRGLLVLRDADPADHTARADNPDGLLLGRQVADRLEHDPTAPGNDVSHRGDAFVAALGDDVGGADRSPGPPLTND
jgi:hypothetical protein